MSGIAVEHRRPETAEEMKIRDAVESDLPAIIKIYNAAVATRVATAQLEQVALDEQRRRARLNGASVLEVDATAARQSQEVSRLLEWSRQLPAAERGSLLARLGAELPAEQQLELLAWILASLSPEALRLLEAELTAGFGARPT